MIEMPQGYNPFATERKLHARLTVFPDDSIPRLHSAVSLTGFTDDSSAAALLDGDYTSPAATTGSGTGTKTIEVTFAKLYPPKMVDIYAAEKLIRNVSLNVTWYDGDTSMEAFFYAKDIRDGIMSLSKPSSMPAPTGVTIEFTNPGFVITQLGLDGREGEGFTVTEEELISLEISEQVDITARSFKPRKLSAEFIPPKGLDKLCDISGRKVNAVIDPGVGSYIPVGEFYADSLIAFENSLRFKLEASDIVAKIARYPSGLFVNSPITVRELMQYPSGAVGGITIIADDYSLDAYVFPHMLTDLDSQRDCLLLLSQAARMSSIWTDRQGRVHISCLHRKTASDGELSPDGIISYSKESYGAKYQFVKVFGENPYGDVYAYSGSYQRGCYANVLKNNFLAASDVNAAADNFLAALNFRHRITLKTRCDPSIEIGDRLTLKDPSNINMGEYIVVGQTMRLDERGLEAEVELAGAGA